MWMSDTSHLEDFGPEELFGLSPLVFDAMMHLSTGQTPGRVYQVSKRHGFGNMNGWPWRDFEEARNLMRDQAEDDPDYPLQCAERGIDWRLIDRSEVALLLLNDEGYGFDVSAVHLGNAIDVTAFAIPDRNRIIARASIDLTDLYD